MLDSSLLDISCEKNILESGVGYDIGLKLTLSWGGVGKFTYPSVNVAVTSEKMPRRG